MILSTEVESAICGVLMLRPEQYDEVQELISPDDFTSPVYRSMYVAICELAAAGMDIDALTIADKTGDMPAAADVLAKAPMGNAKSYATILADRSKLRKFQEAWQEAGRVIQDGGMDLHARVEAIQDILSNAVATDQHAQHTVSGKALVRDWYDELLRLADIGSAVTGINTGFPDLDACTKGWHGGEMIVIAARPGMGKTNLAINTAWAAVRQRRQVLYFSLEMSRLELMHRVAAQACAIDYNDIQTADLGKIAGRVTEFIENASDYGLHINDRAGHTMATVRTESKKIRRKHGLHMVVIDHIGLLNSKHDNQYNKMTEISRQVKLLAKELDIPVIALTQLNRDVEKRPNPRPMMSDLRDSGAIEQDADVVLFPFRDNDPDADHDARMYGQLILGKLRHGKIGIIPVLVQFQFCRFVSADKESLPKNWMLTTQERKSARHSKVQL